jgi:hypothetical protein
VKKFSVSICLVAFCLFFVSSVYAGWGPTKLEYLTAFEPSYTDDPFAPGVAGTNQIQFWSNATFLKRLQVTYEFKSNSYPDWTIFQVSTYYSTGYNTMDLWSGSSDVQYRITFAKTDLYSADTITVSWKYYTCCN